MKDFWNNKKIVITGAAGFIGSHAVKMLLGKEAKIIAVVSPKTDEKKLKNIFSGDVKKISIKKVNLLDAAACLDVTKGCDIILNFAAMDGGSQFKQEHSAEIFKTNMRIVLNMLDAAVANKVDRFLLMSSIEVYPKNAKSPITEEVGWDSSDVANGYVWSKRFSEIVAKMYAEEYGLKIAIARPGNVYGPNDMTGVERGRVIPTFIHKVINNEKIELFDGGKQLKQFIYVDDLIVALLNLTEKYVVCEPINIAGKEAISIKNLANMIITLNNNVSSITPSMTSSRKSDRITCVAKADKYIHYDPKVTLIKGLQNTSNSYKKK